MTRTTSTLARICPLIVVLALVAIAPPAFAGEGSLQTDALIKGGPADAGFLGDGLYNTTGAGQTKHRLVRRGGTDTFVLRVENDGSDYNPVAIHGDGSTKGFRVRYFDGDTNITPEVVGGTYETTCMEDSDFRLLKIYVKTTTRTPLGASTTIMVTTSPISGCGESPGFFGSVAVNDTVGAEVSVTKSGGDDGGLQPRR